jgi:hypothetical protein
MAFKNDVADDMAPVWPRRAPRLAPRRAPRLVPRRAPRLASRRVPCLAPRWASRLAPRLAPSGTPSGRRRVQKKKKKKFFFFGLEKRGKNISVFGFQSQDPQVPRAPRASQAKPQEEEGSFSLVPLVTHPSSIPLLDGLTPKFLSLSFHSL